MPDFHNKPPIVLYLEYRNYFFSLKKMAKHYNVPRDLLISKVYRGRFLYDID
jgi:hypothetical protein